MSERTSCVVVGGGPAGMVLALLLARAGVAVTVLEKHADFLRDFRGDTVHPSTLQLLDELGLAERFDHLPYSRVDEVAFPIGSDRTVVLADFRRLHVPHPYVAMVPQWDLLNLLAEAGREEPSFSLRMRTEMTELIQERGRVRGVRYRTEGGTAGEIRAELVVACDGRWSTARRQAALPSKEFPVPIDVWWFRLPRRPDDEPATLTPRAAPGRFAIVIPRDQYLQIAYVGPKGIDQLLRSRGVERFREDVASLMPEFGDRVDALASMDEVKHLDVRVNRLRRWHADGLLCIGDAAHAMSPVGGVGINLAVQDAVAAATRLAEPLRRGTVTPADLRAVRSRRLLPTAAVQAVQRLMHRALVAPIVKGRRVSPPRPLLTLLRRVPQASYLPAYLIGVGLRPEHAPDYARRPQPTSPADPAAAAPRRVRMYSIAPRALRPCWDDGSAGCAATGPTASGPPHESMRYARLPQEALSVRPVLPPPAGRSHRPATPGGRQQRPPWQPRLRRPRVLTRRRCFRWSRPGLPGKRACDSQPTTAAPAPSVEAEKAAVTRWRR